MAENNENKDNNSIVVQDSSSDVLMSSLDKLNLSDEKKIDVVMEKYKIDSNLELEKYRIDSAAMAQQYKIDKHSDTSDKKIDADLTAKTKVEHTRIIRTVLIIVLPVLLMLIIGVSIWNYIRTGDILGRMAKAPWGAEEVQCMDYDDVVKDLKRNGFSVISKKEKTDEKGIIDSIIAFFDDDEIELEDGDVVAIKIDGKDEFDEGDRFRRDSKVVVTVFVEEAEDDD